MTETAHEVLNYYQVRKTKMQKRAFAQYVGQKAVENGYPVTVEKGSFNSENIVVGDVVLPFPNFITPKNFGIYLLYQIALTVAILAVMFAVDFLIGFSVGYFGTLAGVKDREYLLMLTTLLSTASWLAIMILLLCGPANKHTVNDNTSGVITLLDTMAAMPEELRPYVAFVFFDLEEMGMIGSSAFASRHKSALSRTPALNFDCVSDGETILICPKKKAQGFVTLLEGSFVSCDAVTVEIATKGVFYPSDQMMMPCGIGVAALKKTKSGILYMDRIHTKRDVIFREENIDFLKNASIEMARQMVEA